MLVALLRKQIITQKLLKNYWKKKLIDHDHGKHITTSECNALAVDVFNARLAQANLVAKPDFDNSA